MCFESLHRWRIEIQQIYSGVLGAFLVPDSPCVRLVEFLTGLNRFFSASVQPQLFVELRPDSNLVSTKTVEPQSHWHSQAVLPQMRASDGRTATSFPLLTPAMFLNLVMWRIVQDKHASDAQALGETPNKE